MSRLDEIRAREQAATNGPWEAYDDWYDGPLCAVRTSVGGTEGHVASTAVDPTRDSYDSERSNAQFIAHAREDIPWLLATVERLTHELRQAKSGTS